MIDDIIEIKKAIAKLKSLGDLREINRFAISCINTKKQATDNQIKAELYVGAKVKLKPKYCTGRKGSHLLEKVGQITKLNPTKAKVDFGNFEKWTIPYEMLEIV